MQSSRQFQFGSFEIRVNWIVALCVLITAITLINLGIWQLGRAAEKVDAQVALAEELRRRFPQGRRRDVSS